VAAIGLCQVLALWRLTAPRYVGGVACWGEDAAMIGASAAAILHSLARPSMSQLCDEL